MTTAPTNATPNVAAATPKVASKKRVQLSTTQTLQLHAWIEKNRGWILSETPTFVFAAKEAAAGLGFPVTAINLANVVKAMGFPWPGRDTDPADAIRLLRNDVAFLARMMLGEVNGGVEGNGRLRRIASQEKEALFDGSAH